MRILWCKYEGHRSRVFVDGLTVTCDVFALLIFVECVFIKFCVQYSSAIGLSKTICPDPSGADTHNTPLIIPSCMCLAFQLLSPVLMFAHISETVSFSPIPSRLDKSFEHSSIQRDNSLNSGRSCIKCCDWCPPF